MKIAVSGSYNGFAVHPPTRSGGRCATAGSLATILDMARLNLRQLDDYQQLARLNRSNLRTGTAL
jgi:hypothetical protein